MSTSNCPSCSPSSADYSASSTAAVGGLIDCTQSVSAIVARYPATTSVFHRFGIDTCCGGVLTVTEAARAQQVDGQMLCDSLRGAIAA